MSYIQKAFKFDKVAKLINMPNDYDVTNKLKTVVIDDINYYV